VIVPNVTSVFNAILRFIYTATIPRNQISGNVQFSKIAELEVAASNCSRVTDAIFNFIHTALHFELNQLSCVFFVIGRLKPEVAVICFFYSERHS